MENRHIPYYYRSDVRSLDLLNGITFASKQVLRSDRPIRPLSSRITALYILAAVNGLFFFATLYVKVSWLSQEVLLPLRYALCASAVLWAMQAFNLQKRFNHICCHDLNAPAESGVFFLDAIGFCDTCSTGEVHKPLWRDFQACVITPEIIVLLFETTTLCCSYSPQVEQALTSALQERSFGDRVLHRRIA